MARAADIINHNKDEKFQQTDRAVLQNQNLSPVKEQEFTETELPPENHPGVSSDIIFPKYEPLVPHQFVNEGSDDVTVGDITMTYGNKLKEAYELLRPLRTSEGMFYTLFIFK